MSAEQQQSKIAMYNKYYGDIINGLTRENESLKQNLSNDTFNEFARLYNLDVDNYNKMLIEEEQKYKDNLKIYDELDK